MALRGIKGLKYGNLVVLVTTKTLSTVNYIIIYNLYVQELALASSQIF